jgi:hypothetical protein
VEESDMAHLKISCCTERELSDMSDKIVNLYCGTKQVAGCICSEGRIEGEVTHIVRKCHGSLEKDMY